MKKFILIFLLIIALLGGYGLLKYSKNNNLNNKNFTPNKINLKPTITSLPTPTPKPQIISVTDNGFIPQEITIKAGSTVTWINNASGAVNISSDPYPLNNAYPPLNLGNFNKGEDLSLTFNKTGKYYYHNHIIPPQKGVIIVQ